MSFQVRNGVIHRVDELFQALDALGNLAFVAFERRQQVKITASHDFLDRFQRQTQFPVKQDLLQTQEGLLPIVAIAILANLGWLEQSDLVVVVQGAGGHARQARKLFNGEHPVLQSQVSRVTLMGLL